MTKTYLERAEICTNPAAIHLLRLMEDKKSNLCISADLTKKDELLELVEKVGEEICCVKTHIDIVEDFDMDLIIQLQRMSEEYNFMIFEDRKFADIGNTVKLQYQDGVYHIADWADITNAHTVPGPGVVEGLKEIGMHKGRGLLLLAQMTSKGTLAKDTYTEESIELARAHKDFVIGFISTKKLCDEPEFIYMSPGVKLVEGTDMLGQQYLTPNKVILENESDVIIVGRGIYQADDPKEEAKKYRKAGWDAYKKRIA